MAATLGFYGGAGSVTGANFLLDTGEEKILIDCGMLQGTAYAQKENEAAFPYDPGSVSALLVTHAHADHIGRIPKLIKEGFAGVIYSTPPTRDLAALMLQDAYKIMVYESRVYGTPVLYDETHIDTALRRWKTLPYGETLLLQGGVSAVFTNAGHILGSAFVTFTRNGRKLMVTGDIGNAPQPLLDAPAYPKDLTYLVMESVYGDRAHETKEDRSMLLREAIKDTILKKGTLIIPAFSIERTQTMLYEINGFVERKEIEPIPTFLDSPLAIGVTEVYRKHPEYLKKEVAAQIAAGDDIFDFPKLSFTKELRDSAEIKHVPGPKIIIAGSGMSHGGRIRTHEREYLDEATTTFLLVGYQSVGSVGRRLQDGAKRITIDGEEITVRATVRTIGGYSGHADRDALLSFVEGTRPSLKKVFVAMGEEHAAFFLTQRLRDYLGVTAEVPQEGSVVALEW